MDLIDTLARLASKIPQQFSALQTEEATKNALVMPMINALGYNVFDPLEVVPEFTADVGTKKGEKVDYAINIDGKPMILIECKTIGSKLCLNHASQLFRYFAVTDARFAILTNGVDYHFYTDIEAPNRMDEKPFFEFSMLDLDVRGVGELKKFSKANFDLDGILSNASELKYAKQIKKLIADEYEQPSDELVRMLTGRVYAGKQTAGVREQFALLVRSAFREFVRDEVNARIKTALEGGETVPAFELKPVSKADVPDAEILEDGIETTPEEIEGFHIVRAILAKHVDPARVIMRDTKSYCGVLLDDNNRKPICRLRFNYSQKYIGLFDAEKIETRVQLDELTQIYAQADHLIATVSRYDGPADVADQAPAAATDDRSEG